MIKDKTVVESDNPAAGKFGMFISDKKGKRFTPLGPLVYHKLKVKLDIK